MKTRFMLAIILAAYSALLINIMVFKNVPEIHIGHLRLRFGGTHEGSPNLIPFRSISSYLFGRHGLLIAVINLGGNILLLVPVGLLAPFIFQKMSWKIALAAAVAAGFTIEGMQVLIRVGIFDIDDVILNALGVIIGFWLANIFLKRRTGKTL